MTDNSNKSHMHGMTFSRVALNTYSNVAHRLDLFGLTLSLMHCILTAFRVMWGEKWTSDRRWFSWMRFWTWCKDHHWLEFYWISLSPHLTLSHLCSLQKENSSLVQCLEDEECGSLKLKQMMSLLEHELDQRNQVWDERNHVVCLN